MRLTQAEEAVAAGDLPVWLCTLTLPDGSAIRVATRPLAVRCRDAGGPYQFDPFLVGVTEFEEEIDVFSLDGVGALTQARVEIATADMDLGTMQGDWYAVTAATVELALIWEGQYWEDRIAVLSGGVQGAEFGLEGEPVTLSLETTPPVTSETVGDDARDVGTDWPVAADTAAANVSDLSGTKYQHVFGAAESVPAYKVGSYSGNNRLVLAGHHLARTGASYQISVYEDGVYLGLFTVTNGTINSQPYAYTEDSGGGREFLAARGAFTWKATYGGIAAANGADRPALNAEGIARRLLVDSGLKVDWRQTEPALARLRDWRLAFYADQEAAAVDLLRDRVLRHLPLVEMAGAAGVWLAYCDPHQAPIEAVLTLGQELVGRVGRMVTSDLDAIRNTFVVNYGYEAFAGDLLSTARMDEDGSTLCLLSQQLYGVRADDPIECDATWDSGTASRMMAARASRLALPRRAVSYLVAPDAYWLRAGMVVHLTDPGYGIDQHRAVITRINRGMLPFEATLHLVDRTPFSREVR